MWISLNVAILMVGVLAWTGHSIPDGYVSLTQPNVVVTETGRNRNGNHIYTITTDSGVREMTEEEKIAFENNMKTMENNMKSMQKDLDTSLKNNMKSFEDRMKSMESNMKLMEKNLNKSIKNNMKSFEDSMRSFENNMKSMELNMNFN